MDRHAEPEYRRYIAVLRENHKNYAITPTRRPRGKATIEVRGNSGLLKCSVKNLTPLRDSIKNQQYNVWLVNEEAHIKIPVQAGTIDISKEGFGESSWTFDVNQVKNNGVDLDSFITLEIRVNSSNRRIPGDRVLVGQLELEEVNMSEEPKMEKVTPFGGALPLHQWWKFYPGYFNEWMHNPSSSGQTQSQKSKGMASELPGQAYGGLPGTGQPLPQDCFGKGGEYQTGPVFQGHQLVGLEQDDKGAVKFLVHGIPGRFCFRDQPYGGVTGYSYWYPLPGQHYKAGDYGYWLIYIDPTTGEVVFPKKATVPPDCDHCNKI